jgi:hypothetical protein
MGWYFVYLQQRLRPRGQNVAARSVMKALKHIHIVFVLSAFICVHRVRQEKPG